MNVEKNHIETKIIYCRGVGSMGFIKRLVTEEDGQGMVEYGLIIALVSIVVIAVLTLIGTNLNGIFTKIADNLNK
jgi:pilus assembly protein Flp/PilA